MKQCGVYCKINDGYDIDEYINKEAEKAIYRIQEIKKEVPAKDFNVIIKAIIREYLDSL